MLLGRALPLTREALKFAKSLYASDEYRHWLPKRRGDVSGRVPRLSLVRFCSSETTVIRVSNNLELRTRQNATENDCTSTKPLVLIFAWMLPQRRHLQKFENIYLARGCDVMTINIKPLQLMLPKTGAQVIAEKVVDFVHQPQNARRPLLVHAFSVGGYLYSETLLKSFETSSEAGSMKDRIMGQIFDSPVDFIGIPDGLPAAMFKSPLLRATLRTMIKTYMAALYKQVTVNYIRASEIFHFNPVRSPALFLYSKVDPVGKCQVATITPSLWKMDIHVSVGTVASIEGAAKTNVKEDGPPVSSEIFGTAILPADPKCSLPPIAALPFRAPEHASGDITTKQFSANQRVYYKCWDDSPHVQHMYKHPIEYVEIMDSFLSHLPPFAGKEDSAVRDNGKLTAFTARQ
ncbi:TMEM53 [Branchiostoma lanceolatum]|uniref:TMEM53 protein n=1 Tax=Branchiostoma lanceolatum TaxID=7740 RepID=A0A8J9ZT16_BRALA|nr:TMEM53 [Branchiostoma lanceolatum]